MAMARYEEYDPEVLRAMAKDGGGKQKWSTPVGIPCPPGVSVVACLRCGALVAADVRGHGYQLTHDIWHDALEERIAAADLHG